MPPSVVSLKRSRKVPETIFFSSRRSWLRLTKPMMRLGQMKPRCDPKGPGPICTEAGTLAPFLSLTHFFILI